MVPWVLTALLLFSRSTGSWAPCMERGRRASHGVTSNGTSCSVRHPFWLKLKQIKRLPVVKHLSRRKQPPSVACSLEKPALLGPSQQALPSCCHRLCFSPEELRDFTLSFKITKRQQAARTNVGRLPAPSSRRRGWGWKMIWIGKQIFFYTF